MDNHQRNDHGADPWTVHQQCKKYFKKLVSRVDFNYRTERWKDFISCDKCLKALKVLITSFHLQIKIYIYKIVDSNSHNLKLWIKPEEETTTDTLIYSEFVRQEQMKFCFVSFVILICLSSLGELRQTALFLGAILVTARWSENKSKSWPPAATSLKSTQTCQTKWKKKETWVCLTCVCIYSSSPSSTQEALASLVSSPDNPLGGPVSTETQLPPVWLVQEETNKTRQSSLFWISADWKVWKAARSKVWSTSCQLVSGAEGFVSLNLCSVALRRNHCRKSWK